MHFEDDQVCLFGGQGVQPSVRFDILLEKKRQKYQMKYRRVRTVDATEISMDMYYPFAIRENKMLYFYSAAKLHNEWMLRIELADSMLDGHSVKQGAMRFYAIDYESKKIGRV